MNLVADESVEREVVERLRAEGHDTIYIAELAPSITDDKVLDEANLRNAMLVTADKDFGEWVYRLGRIHAGVILIRLGDLSPTGKAETAARVIHHHAVELLSAFCVISPGSVRIRRPLPPEQTI